MRYVDDGLSYVFNNKNINADKTLNTSITYTQTYILQKKNKNKPKLITEIQLLQKTIINFSMQYTENQSALVLPFLTILTTHHRKK